jgi:hypothetical protein
MAIQCKVGDIGRRGVMATITTPKLEL